MAKIKLGQEVKDPITGFQGIAICRHSYLNGCDRITAQAPYKEGEDIKEFSFDEPQLEVVGDGVYQPPKNSKSTGGPAKHMDSGRTLG